MLKAAVFLLSVFLADPASALPMAPLEDYTRPAELITLPDGRRMNLYCLGSGAPVVILDAGLGQGTSAWRPVQAPVAEMTRVCAFDRAGLGFSDAGPMPRDATAMVKDEKELLDAAKLGGRYILVGHSLAGLNARLYASLHPEEVAGMVLVDPTPTHWDRRIKAVAPTISASANMGRDRRRACADGVISGSFVPGEPGFDTCFPPPPRSLPEAVRKMVLARQGSKDMHRTINSESDAEEASSAQIAQKTHSLGSIPLIVLTATAPAYSPDTPATEKAAAKSLWSQSHEEIVRLSSRGEHRWVETGHYIVTERPEAVISAIKDVVLATRSAHP